MENKTEKSKNSYLVIHEIKELITPNNPKTKDSKNEKVYRDFDFENDILLYIGKGKQIGMFLNKKEGCIDFYNTKSEGMNNTELIKHEGILYTICKKDYVSDNFKSAYIDLQEENPTNKIFEMYSSLEKNKYKKSEDALEVAIRQIKNKYPSKDPNLKVIPPFMPFL